MREVASPSAATVRRPASAGAVAATAFAFWVVMAGTTVPTPLYPRYQAEFGFGPLAVTVMFAVYALGVTIGLLTVSRLSDQAGRRPVVWAALLLALVAAAIFLVAETLPVLLVGRVVSGFSAALVTGAATAAVVELLPAGRRGTAPIVALLANMGGLASGTLVAGVVAEWGGAPLRLPWAGHAVLVVVAALFLLWVPETVQDRRRLGRIQFTPQRLRVPGEIREVFLRSAMAGGAGFAVLGVLTAVTGILLRTELDRSNPALTGFVVFLAFACTAVGQLIVRRVPGPAATTAACLALIVAAALVGTAVLAPSLVALLAAAVLAGLSTGTAIGAGLASIAAGAAPERRGEAVSTFFAILYTMLAFPAVGVGVLIHLRGLRLAGTVFAVAVALLAALAASYGRANREAAA